MPSHRELASLSRRDLFRMAASAGVALGGGAATGLIGARPAQAQTTSRPTMR